MTFSPDEQPATRSDVRRVHERLDTLTGMIHERFVTNADLHELAKRVDKLEGWQDWAARLVIGAVILALIGLIVTGGTVK